MNLISLSLIDKEFNNELMVKKESVILSESSGKLSLLVLES